MLPLHPQPEFVLAFLPARALAAGVQSFQLEGGVHYNKVYRTVEIFELGIW